MDTNVLVAGACRRESSYAHQVLMGILQRHIPLILTASIALEYEDVLQRLPILQLTRLTKQQSTELVTTLVALSNEVQVRFLWRPNLLDESDNKFIEAAMHTRATIISYNTRDFLHSDM